MQAQSLIKISLFSCRQDVIYLCKKAVESKFEISQTSDFSQFNFISSSINIIDSQLLYQNQNILINPDSKLANTSICLLSPDTPDSALSIIEENFPYTLAYPPDPQLLLSYIEILNSKQSNSNTTSLQMKKDSYIGPTDIMGFFPGTSALMYKLRNEIHAAAMCDTPILLLGDTGVGKTTAAQLIHNLSTRGLHKMQSVNMATVIEGLAESTLFGTKEGGYTDATNREGLFKTADKSTLFLDEIGTASNVIQSKLLTVLETGLIKKVGSDVKEKVDVRVITSTNANIRTMLEEGTFRKDFYFRISDLIIEIPPLKKHKEDLRIICNEYVKDKNITFSEQAFKKIEDYNWPGNIRELHQCINRALIKCTGNVITPEVIDFGLFN